MAHLTLQLGVAIVVPFSAPRKMIGNGPPWRTRAIHEAAALSADLDQSGQTSLRGRGRRASLLPATAAPAMWGGSEMRLPVHPVVSEPASWLAVRPQSSPSPPPLQLRGCPTRR
jgi:hypothetical protein